jgi:hypothetical protein
MIKVCWAAAAALCCIASTGWGEPADEARTAEERLLGNAGEETQQQSYLPFTRRLTASGVVDGPFEDSLAKAGVPPVAALETMRAFRAAIDLDEDLMDGDRFTVNWRQEYTVEGNPIGVPHVMWAELGTAARCRCIASGRAAASKRACGSPTARAPARQCCVGRSTRSTSRRASG